MADIVDRETRSRMMASIRGKDTKPEMQVRRFLHGHGFRYRLHDRSMPGCPDIILPRYHTVIFVNGCFWHRHQDCPLAYNPKSDQIKWQEKFNRNVSRDSINLNMLLKDGWRVIIVWECGLRNSSSEIFELLECRILQHFKSEITQLPLSGKRCH